MGLFARRQGVEERATISLSAYANAWAGLGGFTPSAVSRATALTHAASSACIDTLASSISQLPFEAVRQSGDIRVPVRPSPQIIGDPSPDVDQDVWLYQLAESLFTDGNAFGEILSYSGANPSSIELIDPSTVTHRRYVNGVATVAVSNIDRQLWPAGDLWHVPGKLVHAGSRFADSPVVRAQATIGAAIDERDFGSRFFSDGGHPGAVIRSNAELSEEQARSIKAAFRNATSGNRDAMVMGAGLEYEPLMVDPNDSQFLDLMRFCLEESCRFWRVPPAMIYGATSGQHVTYANVSQADMAYLKHSLEPHLRRIERALSRLLPKPQFARFNRNAFLRSDPVTRSEVVDRRLRNSTMTVNEARALEDEKPFADPEFDDPGIPDDAPDTTSTDMPSPLEVPDA